MAETAPPSETLARTALHPLHVEAGARFAPFAGYEMPIQYPAQPDAGGIMAEHAWCRSHAALFDVSHMGVVDLSGEGVGPALERVLPSAVSDLPVGRQRYSYLLNETGGIIDDLMVARLGDRYRLVLNAANKAGDVAWMRSRLPDGVEITPRDDLCLVALQGPEAGAVIADRDPATDALCFMDVGAPTLAGVACGATRSGYTGEDGFEIALPVDRAGVIVRDLLADARVRWAGLGARDTLRLEAGLPLHGQDVTPEISPIEAGLGFAIQKRRRAAADFVGAAPVLAQAADGPPRKLVGLAPQGRAPVRQGTVLADAQAAEIGVVTSGGFSPSLERPIALGLVRADAADADTLIARLRGREVACTVTPLPFVPHRYRRRSTA